MAVKWIGDAAREQGLSPLDAVELLAAKGEYPYNGFLDEDRLLLLRRRLGEGHGSETTGSMKRPLPPLAAAPAPPQPPPPAPAPRPAPPETTARYAPGERTSVTAPLPTGKGGSAAPQPPPVPGAHGGLHPERSEERTVIIPPPGHDS